MSSSYAVDSYEKLNTIELFHLDTDLGSDPDIHSRVIILKPYVNRWSMSLKLWNLLIMIVRSGEFRAQCCS